MSGNLLYGFLLKFSGGIVKIACNKFIRIVWKKYFLGEIIWKHTTSGNLLFWFLLKFSGGVVKVAYYKCIQTFQLKKFHLKKSSPWCCSDLVGFIFGKLLEFFQENCWNCNLRVNSKNLLRKIMIFSTSLSHIGKTISSVSRNFWDEVVKNLILFVEKNLFLEHFFEGLVFLFSLGLDRSFSPFPFCRDFSVGVV